MLINTGTLAFYLQNPGSPAPERASPVSRIPESAVHVYADRVVLDIKDAVWARFENSNSMDPVLDEGDFGIEVKPKSVYDIQVGDIAAYRNKDGDVIIHRIVEIGDDQFGRYFVFKGDNVPIVDPEQVRFDQIDAILVAVVY